MKLKTKIKLLLWLEEYKINFKDLNVKVFESNLLAYAVAACFMLLICVAYPLFFIVYLPKLICNLAYKILDKR